MEPKISMMDTLTIRTAAPFKNLFPIKENLLDEIAADMKQNGYDFAHPIIIWPVIRSLWLMVTHGLPPR